MRVGADAQTAGSHQAFFGKKRVLNAHHADVHKVFDVVFVGKGACLLDQGCRLDVLVGGKMIHYHGDFGIVKYRCRAVFLKHIDGDG